MMQKRKVVVVGAGIVGLTTAKRLAKEGCSVAVLSADGPSSAANASTGAGGFWMPFKMAKSMKALPSRDAHLDAFDLRDVARQTLLEFYREKDAGGRRAQHIEGLPALVLKSEQGMQELESWTTIPELNFHTVTREEFPKKHPHLKARIPEGVYGAWFFDTLVVHCEPYLADLAQELTELGVHQESGAEYRFSNFGAALEAGESVFNDSVDALFNCTGLGANDLCELGTEVIPGRGVLLQVERPAGEVDAVMTSDVDPWSGVDCAYVIPRGPNLVSVGGSFQKGSSGKHVSEEEAHRLRLKAEYLFPCLEGAKEHRRWAGLRPLRDEGPRLELQTMQLGKGLAKALPVVHNYGHGGGGWTVAYGCADWTVQRWKTELARADTS